MLAMYYDLHFGDDFDMSVIRDWAAEKAPLFDRYPGLVQKAFLSNEVKEEILGDTVGNTYAAFYVWDTNAAARDFLLSSEFQGLSISFGRPRVRSWQVVSFRALDGAAPSFAVKETARLREGTDLSTLADEERPNDPALLADSGLQARIVGIDPYRWDLVRFSLWSDAERARLPDRGDSETFEVLHLSTPRQDPTARGPGPPWPAAPIGDQALRPAVGARPAHLS